LITAAAAVLIVAGVAIESLHGPLPVGGATAAPAAAGRRARDYPAG